MKITLEVTPMGITVTRDDDGRWDHGLSRDEALWTVAEILNDRPGRYLKTDEEHETWNKKYRNQNQKI